MDDLDDSFDRLLLDSDEEEENYSNDDPQPALIRVEDANDSDDSSDSDDDEVILESQYPSWSSTFEPKEPFTFSDENSGVQDDAIYGYTDAIQFWRLFFTDEMVQLILTETNRYGYVKYTQWKPMEKEELFNFFGICIQMGLEKRAKLADYWSTRSIFSPSFAAKLMSRNRFTQILNSLHFADNELIDRTNRLYKIQPILDMLNESFLKVYRPGKDVTIDESMVPFRGRVVFRQYIKGKRHRFGIKLFKACSKGGYTSKLQVYAGKQGNQVGPVAENVVMSLMEPFLNQGRVLTADNFYSSIPLVDKLLSKETDYVGTLRRNRVGIPQEVKNTRLKRGETIGRQNAEGVTVLRWKDKRELMMLSSFHDASHGETGKPKAVEYYNLTKGFVDLSDQMAAYTPFVRRTTKWYLRLFFHLLTQTAMTNAWFLHCKTAEKVTMTEFKSRIIESILKKETTPRRSPLPFLVEVPGPKRSNRRRCVSCYQKLVKMQNTPYARTRATQVNTKCSICENFFCLTCFQTSHKRCSM